MSGGHEVRVVRVHAVCNNNHKNNTTNNNNTNNTNNNNICMHICVHVCIYIYIYIYIQRGREILGGQEVHVVRVYHCMYLGVL